MFEFLKKLMPREDNFFALFEAHAATGRRAAAELRAILEGGPEIVTHCSRLMAVEEEADAIALDVSKALHSSFITPFDRSDIKALISALDDAVDQMNRTAKAVMLFEVTSFEPQMKQMADIAMRMADVSAEALPLLRAVGQNAERLHEITNAMIAIEEESDQLNDSGLKALIKASKSSGDPMAYITGAEIYEHLEKVADRFEDVANVINGIVIEHV
ncbi:MAG: DUF47 family protein [Rhizobiaceae bacterium]